MNDITNEDMNIKVSKQHKIMLNHINYIASIKIKYSTDKRLFESALNTRNLKVI